LQSSPPLSEQQRFAAVLKEQMAAVERARSGRQKMAEGTVDSGMSK
jgi:hypothetical protein